LVVKRVMQDTQDHVDEVFDLENLSVRTLVYDKTILQKIFRRAG